MKKIYYLGLLLLLCSKTLFAQDAYLGEIKLFAGSYAPKGWAKCEGQLLLINQNLALFSLLGTTYGGNGSTNFALPDYRGRAATGVGPLNLQGQKVGAESTTLTPANLPAHSHIEPIKVSSSKATLNIPTAGVAIASPVLTANSVTRDMLGYNAAQPNSPLSGEDTTAAGTASPTAINTVQPFLALTYIIALQGIFPSQN
jgi:microcystin-dependent protein